MIVEDFFYGTSEARAEFGLKPGEAAKDLQS
jgi:hypothetical protein